MGWHRNLTSIIVVAVMTASCGLPTTNAAPDELPTMAMAAAFQSGGLDVEFHYQELVRESNDTSPKLQGQPYPSDPNGARSSGRVFFNPPDSKSNGSLRYEATPSPQSILLPRSADPEASQTMTFRSGRDCTSIVVRTFPLRQYRTEGEVDEGTILYERTGYVIPIADDPVCDFIFPGTLAHRILPPQPPPADIDAYFAELAKHPFTYDHSIHMYGETVYVYKWETVTDGITEIREVGVTPDDRLFYLNWWRSEPYDGEEVTRRILIRSCSGTCD